MTFTTATTRAATLNASFSFYVPGTDPTLIRVCAEAADAVVIKGPRGPREVKDLRAADWQGIVLFDRAAYERGSAAVDPGRWMAEQAGADADRLLTPGSWVKWDPTGEALRRAVDCELLAAAAATNSTLLFALDSRWLRKGLYETIDILRPLDHPIALVFAHRDDPLGPLDAVHGLLALTHNIADLTVLRCDHGAIGAVAFGAAHGSIGLRTTYRHFVPPDVNAQAIPNDRTPRVFVWDLMDWFTSFRIAGWATTPVRIACKLTCCNGLTLDRFLDDRLAAGATLHNRTVLAHLADYVLDAPPAERRRVFGRLCSDAVARYGPMGKLSEIIQPKAQLVQWAQFA